ncbi:hypothetical protein I8752_07090 [Nostocaceae cyanobacterium CENA369]|uniref:Uncharacterized protein n=1 Tax=Dendronalium phyllosphericum CENA369 TaxID=1725256 RepID=A0A8J7I320_9NOST|nr:hypothetical protein [Dendronalium phyllosphericum]MBH8572783.1 hypothetical protein [Dendronalium phyllosphericum CENA369]
MFICQLQVAIAYIISIQPNSLLEFDSCLATRVDLEKLLVVGKIYYP